ncbi:putative sodium-coupled neutral amino acid transporter 10 isoform X2 [Strongylocentrotus purpuratus]|uniref:Amino acid transporter transmembrane domain-containing protein n=1 Tax=Strongylocentrotus purpuratus TaxID=7668 RepID=A0A7M7NSL0_STRPU|nr:putative sodium-coupled neutral amino acid transporter 10 isoform X2 [Strongylocentrotus purpuratus]
MGQTPWSAVINLSNSIIGVSVLAMPWCFKECGVVLAILLLFITGIVNKFSCNLLLKSSKATRKYSYETLSHHTLGGMGKLAVEISVILLLMCTCIAFFVIIGDLGPSLVSKFWGIENTSNLRTFILLGTAIFIILPLAQKRNVESLSALSTMSICFYFFFATSVFVDSLPRLVSLEWINTVVFWRPAGILKGMSIFALSMCCQATLFPIYNSLQERTPKMMEDVVSKGVNLVAFVYMAIGFFGYITYYTDGIKGDILLNQPPSLISDGLKLGFALSVALSFPLCVFPCRASIFSLLCPNADSNPITGMTHIPPIMFRVITVVILAITLTIAILIPNVEVVLSLTGATMGSLACFILPALIYQHTVGVPTRFMPKVLLIIGICFMLFSTYDNVRPGPQDPHIPAPVQVFDKLDKIQIAKLDEAPVDALVKKPDGVLEKSAEKMGLQGDDVIKEKEPADAGDIMAAERDGEVKRQEPPIPHAPVDLPDSKDKAIEDVLKVGEGKEGEGEKDEVQLEVPEKKVEKEKEAEGDRDGRDLEGDAGAGKKESKEIAGETEEKFKVQEEKQEIQEKKLEELQARQVIQERLIVKQAEELDILKKEHEDEKQKDEDLQNVAVQLQQQQLPQQPAVVGDLQQPAGPGVRLQPVAGGQPIIGQPLERQVGDQQLLGQLGQLQVPVQPVGQLPVAQQALGQLPVAQQALGQLPVAQQALGQLPVAQQAMGQLPVAQQALGQLPVAQQALGQLPVAQQALGQLPMGQAAVQPLAAQQLAGQGQQQFAQQQQLGAAGQQVVQVGIQGAGGMGQNLPVQQQHAGLEGMNQVAGMGGVLPQQQQQQQLMQGGVAQQQGVLLDVAGMQAAAVGGGGGLGQANIMQQQQQQFQQPQQVPLALQQQQQLLQQPPQQQQQVLMQQQQVPVQQNQQPALQILPDTRDGLLGGGAAMGQQPLQQQGMVGGGGDGMVANAGFADMNQAQGGAVVVEGGIPQQPQHVEMFRFSNPADKMIKSADKVAILEPGQDLNLAGIQQRVLNQAGADGDKESKKQEKEEQKEEGKEGESDGVIQIVGEEEEAEEAEEGIGKGNGDGDVVPALEEERGGAIADLKDTGNQELDKPEKKRRHKKGKRSNGETERREEDEEEEEEEEEEEKENDGNQGAPLDDAERPEDQLQGMEDKLLENHLKMIDHQEEEEFADQEDVIDVNEKDADEGKIEMNQEQNDPPQEKKIIRSREEV